MLSKIARLNLCVTVLTLAPSVQAHPFHVSLAEVEYNQDANALEVALRVFPDDLELALRQRTGEHVVLETSPDIESIVADYVQQAFVVKAGAEGDAQFEWVGIELGVKEAWIYFVWRDLGDLNEAVLTNTVLFDVRPSQMNTVVVSIGPETRTYTFTIDEPTQQFVDTGHAPPIVLEVQRRHEALVVIIQNAAHLSRAERAAFELLASCAAQLLLHPSEPEQEAEDQDLLDAALELVRQGPGGEVRSADRARLGIMSASAGYVRVAFNLLAEAIATSAAKKDARAVLSEAIRAAAKLALRHGDNDRAQSMLKGADGDEQDVLLALGAAQAYVQSHDHD